MSGNGNGDLAAVLEIGTARTLAKVKIDGQEHAMKAPRVCQFAQLMRLMQELKEATPADGRAGDPTRQIGAAIGVIKLMLPTVPPETIDELEIDGAMKLIEFVESTVNGWMAKKERDLDANPSSGEPSKSPASGASPSMTSSEPTPAR